MTIAWLSTARLEARATVPSSECNDAGAFAKLAINTSWRLCNPLLYIGHWHAATINFYYQMSRCIFLLNSFTSIGAFLIYLSIWNHYCAMWKNLKANDRISKQICRCWKRNSVNSARRKFYGNFYHTECGNLVFYGHFCHTCLFFYYTTYWVWQ